MKIESFDDLAKEVLCDKTARIAASLNRLKRKIGEQFDQRRQDLNMSLGDVAKETGIGPMAIFRCFKGDSGLPLSSLVEVADALRMQMRISLVPSENSSEWSVDWTYKIPEEK